MPFATGRAQSPAALPATALGTCPPVQVTPALTMAYGTLTAGGSPAAVGAVVEARNPRGNTVGCFVVQTEGHYGAMFVFGEDTTASPVIPGMRPGETVQFFVDGMPAVAAPVLIWRDDKDPHQVHLSAGLAGDLDNDCDVDIVDIMLVASRWSLQAGDVRYEVCYDLDRDADIDIVDIMRVAARWGTSCTSAAPQAASRLMHGPNHKGT